MVSCRWKAFGICIILTFLLCLISVTLAASSKCSMAATNQRERRGLILWSYGRSATGSLMKTLNRTANLSYCNGVKESFTRGPWLSSSGFQDCMDRGELLVHITPSDLTRGRSKLRTPEEVFQAAYKAGFSTLITNFRENQLAQEVSHYRQGLLGKKNRVPTNFDRIDILIPRWEFNRSLWIRGVEAAQEIGLTVVPCRFASLVENVCPCAEAAISTLSSKRFETCPTCRGFKKHSEGRKDKTLELLVPPKVAAGLREHLLGTAYEWMLNLSAMDWPKDVAPPVPMPKDVAPPVPMHVECRLNPCEGLLARLFSFHSPMRP